MTDKSTLFLRHYEVDFKVVPYHEGFYNVYYCDRMQFFFFKHWVLLGRVHEYDEAIEAMKNLTDIKAAQIANERMNAKTPSKFTNLKRVQGWIDYETLQTKLNIEGEEND